MDAPPEVFAALVDEMQRRDPPPCAGCTACCRHNQAVELKPEHGDDPRQYAYKWIENLGDHYGMVLARKPDGSCHYLGEAGCTIYDRRPAACRGFDCRRMVRMFPGKHRADAIACGLFPSALFEAGEARIATMQAQPWEEAVFDGSIAERLIADRRG